MTSIAQKSLKLLLILAIGVFALSCLEMKILKNEVRCHQSIMRCEISHNENTVSGNLDLFQELTRVKMDFRMSLRESNSHNYQSISNGSQDFCEFVKTSTKDPWANLVWKLLNANSNNRLFGKCPVPVVTCLNFKCNITLIFVFCFPGTIQCEQLFVKLKCLATISDEC